MIDRLKIALPEVIENCISLIENKHTFVFEDDKAIFVSAKDKFHLHIENQSKTSFHFIQNDDCVMKNIKGGQCDYVICNQKTIYFIEVKVAIGNLANHRKDAYNQIENTFKHYSKKIIFANDHNLNALVCFPSKRRTIKASESTKKKEFKLNYKINLHIGNYILFE
jgi:hypothetical protein